MCSPSVSKSYREFPPEGDTLLQTIPLTSHVLKHRQVMKAWATPSLTTLMEVDGVF